ASHDVVEVDRAPNGLNAPDALVIVDDAVEARDLIEHHADELVVLVERSSELPLFLEKLEGAFDGRERVLQIVRHLARESTEHGEALDALPLRGERRRDLAHRRAEDEGD